MNQDYDFNLRKAEIFDRRNFKSSSPDGVYSITKIASLSKKTLEIIEQNLFNNDVNDMPPPDKFHEF